MMWDQSIDIYCERLDERFWAEPINALTNIAFIIAGILAVKMIKDRSTIDPRSIMDINILAIVIILIGIGSFLFHTFATRWSALADEIPIRLFMALYLMSFMIRILRFSWVGASLGLVAFIVLTIMLLKLWPGALNGSIAYIPALVTLAIFSTALLFKKDNLAKLMLGTTFIFTVSVTFRSIDMQLCSNLAFGTHFVWHILNAIVLYRLVKLLLLSYQLSALRDS